MRKGYMLIEMIVLIGVIAIFFIVFAEPIRVLLADTPRGYRNFQTATSLNHLANSMKTDVEAGKNLVLASDDPSILTILGGTETVSYRFMNDRVLRMTGSNTEPDGEWDLPDSRWAWSINGSGAVEFTSWIEMKVLGHSEKKFYNSHLFYTKGFQRRPEQ